MGSRDRSRSRSREREQRGSEGGRERPRGRDARRDDRNGGERSRHERRRSRSPRRGRDSRERGRRERGGSRHSDRDERGRRYPGPPPADRWERGRGPPPRPNADPNGPPDSGDEMLSKEAQDFKSFRTLKRRMLLEKRRALMWQFTPSPEPEDPTRKRIVEENEAALSKMKAEWEQRHAKHHQENEEEDDAVCSADEEEADLFRKFIEGHREELMEIKKAAEVEEPQEDVVGPTLPGTAGDTGGGAGGYGLYLRPGEGQAMASYVQSGKRIPRRGEVGLDADSIAKYEAAGYVMSGNRHARMNAIRIRKENQVYTAEEKAALAMINFEEKKAKEEQVLADLKALVDEKLGEAQG